MRVEIEDITVEVDVHGTDGPAVMLIHGLGGSRAVWSDVAAHLAAGARVYVPDLRGCGNSARGQAAYTLAQIGDDLAALAHALRLPKIIAVGHSLGGVIVQELLTRHAAILAGAVLVSTSSRLNEAATRSWQKLADVVAARGLSDSSAGQARSFSEAFANAHPEILAMHARMSAATDRHVYAEQARAASRYDYTEALALVTTPALIVQGLADRLTPPGGSVLLHRALPGSRLEMIEGAGHNLPIELPEQFAKLVLAFAGELKK